MQTDLTPPSPPASFAYALAIPELLRLICNELERREVASLLRVSRSLFLGLIPILWEDVDLKSILSIIPEIRIVGSRELFSPHHIVFDFPPIPDTTRLGIYSPFIKTLRTTKSHVLKFPRQIEHSEMKLNFSSLFPNLRRLALTTAAPADRFPIEWISIFFVPSLRELSTYSILHRTRSEEDFEMQHAWINLDICTDFISQIGQFSPLIETLEIYPREPVDDDMYGLAKLCRGILSLQHLRTLSCSVACASQVFFQALGQLPHLGSLTLVSDWTLQIPQWEEPLDLTDDLFPMLRHLKLRGISTSFMQCIYDSSPLFHHLISLSIIYDIHDASSDDKSEKQRIRSYYASRCCRHNNSFLRDLTVLTMGVASDFTLDWNFIDILKRLPLCRLRLANVVCESRIETAFAENDAQEYPPHMNQIPTWEDIVTVLPDLEVLDLAHRSLGPQELALFAYALPKLRQLTSWTIKGSDGIPGGYEKGRTAIQPIVIRCRRWEPLLLAVPYKDYLSTLARRVYDLWPNATFDTRTGWCPLKRTADEDITVELNNSINALRIQAIRACT